jgi:hypothetical protein
VPNRSLNVTALALAIAAVSLSPTDALGQKRQRDVITREDNESVMQGSTDLFQVIRKLRPQFLEPPKGGPRTLPAGRREVTNPATGASGTAAVGGSSGPILVAVDGRRETGIEALKTITPALVEEVRYLDPSRSQNQFGFNASSGAIVVKMRTLDGAKPKDPPSE